MHLSIEVHISMCNLIVLKAVQPMDQIAHLYVFSTKSLFGAHVYRFSLKLSLVICGCHGNVQLMLCLLFACDTSMNLLCCVSEHSGHSLES
jgi:hypothetical protein